MSTGILDTYFKMTLFSNHFYPGFHYFFLRRLLCNCYHKFSRCCGWLRFAAQPKFYFLLWAPRRLNCHNNNNNNNNNTIKQNFIHRFKKKIDYLQIQEYEILKYIPYVHFSCLRKRIVVK